MDHDRASRTRAQALTASEPTPVSQPGLEVCDAWLVRGYAGGYRRRRVLRAARTVSTYGPNRRWLR